jgi:hypothetical protein
MRLVKLSELFDVRYGTSLELNALEKSCDGINFVSRTEKNNGVSSKVESIQGLAPICGGVLTVALGGSVLETFLQPEPFYTGFHVACLHPKSDMTDRVKLFYAACIRANKYRYSYGRQANRTLKNIQVPDLSEIPAWVHQSGVERFGTAARPLQESKETILLDVSRWKGFRFDSLFSIKKGKRLTKASMTGGSTPYIGAIDSNNGVSAKIGQAPTHQGGTITVSYNGSVAEAFYQHVPFWATDDVNVLYPKFKMSPYVALFFCAVIRLEKYRFNYGRKWGLERMKASVINLPVDSSGAPDWTFMENYIKSLPFSSSIQDVKSPPEPAFITHMRQEAMRENPEGVEAGEEMLSRFFGNQPPSLEK